MILRNLRRNNGQEDICMYHSMQFLPFLQGRNIPLDTAACMCIQRENNIQPHRYVGPRPRHRKLLQQDKPHHTWSKLQYPHTFQDEKYPLGTNIHNQDIRELYSSSSKRIQLGTVRNECC